MNKNQQDLFENLNCYRGNICFMVCCDPQNKKKGTQKVQLKCINVSREIKHHQIK